VIKRVVDVAAATCGLLLLMPAFAVVAVAIKLDSPGDVLFQQVRVGKNFRRFHILKFRTMRSDSSSHGALVTAGGDPRITRVGRWLRRLKLDELPQLFNVLRGDMSLVGPRPEVPKYVELFKREYEEVLKVRPGMTDLASLKYRDESGLLARAENPHEEYVRRILPDKLQLGREYVSRSSLALDLLLIARTVGAIAGARVPRFGVLEPELAGASGPGAMQVGVTSDAPRPVFDRRRNATDRRSAWRGGRRMTDFPNSSGTPDAVLANNTAER
jgi:lipopolysaccharide/colanic/teichoic acid biosynthesis glycosyltransferase